MDERTSRRSTTHTARISHLFQLFRTLSPSAALVVIAVLSFALDAAAQHHFVLEFDDPSCEAPLRSLPEQRSEAIGILYPDLHAFYAIAPNASDDTPDVQELLTQTREDWRAAHFERALERSQDAPNLLQTQAFGAINPELRALLQLRITVHLLLGDEDNANKESDALLSRERAAVLCQESEFPEACEHLQQREASQKLRWEDVDDELRALSEFAAQSERTLSLIDKRDATVRWTLIEDGERTHQHEARGNCQRADFWHRTLDEWNALLDAEYNAILNAPPPRVRALERSMRIGVPVALVVLTGLSIAGTVHFKNRDRHFERCGRLSSICPEIEDIKHAYIQRRRARRWAIGAWSATGAVALAPIPLALFKRRALRHAQSDDVAR